MWQKFFIGIGRILLAYIFIIGAVNKILNWEAMHEHVGAMLSDWQAYVTGIDWLENLFSYLVSMPGLLLGVATGMELLGGVSILIGFRAHWGAFLLILFLIPTTILYHHFWYLEGHAREQELVAFMKNISILGGLLIVWASTSLIKKLEAHSQ